MENNLSKIFTGQPQFRVKQIKQAIFRDLVSDWKDANWLPLGLKEKLAVEFPLLIPAVTFTSKDQTTTKALITLTDGLKIEAVLMRHDNRNTICVSTQVGCPMGCLFCATGGMGYKRNLTSWEIVEQVLYFTRLLKKENQAISNIVIMGMGEPFLNYENVMSAVRIINDQDGLGIGARHISISTVGVIDGINKLAKEDLQVNLAISLHAPNDKIRLQLMPIDLKYSIGKIMDAVGDYLQRTNRKVMFEYIMIEGVNDSENSAKELAALIASFKKPLIMVNVIKYNETGKFKASSNEQIKKFKDVLIKEGIFVTERYRFGQDIQAACGQLATRISKG